MKKKFGFYPSHLEIDAGPVKVRSLPELGTVVDSVLASNEVENGWIYAPLQPVQEFMSGEIRTYPYSARVFGLAKTHTIEHGAVTGEEHLEFHVWALSFFAGMRLTTTEAGFLDGTPLKPGSLVDFVLVGAELGQAIELAESFWLKNLDRPRNARLLVAAIHALFLGQYRQALQFEEFIHLYTAIDACYALTAALRRPKESFTHGERIEWMCDELGVRTPPWAKTTCTRSTVVSALRNDALHEALFVGRTARVRGAWGQYRRKPDARDGRSRLPIAGCAVGWERRLVPEFIVRHAATAGPAIESARQRLGPMSHFRSHPELSDLPTRSTGCSLVHPVRETASRT